MVLWLGNLLIFRGTAFFMPTTESVRAKASEMGYDLADSEAEKLLVAFVAALPIVANYIRLRFMTSEPIALGAKKR